MFWRRKRRTQDLEERIWAQAASAAHKSEPEPIAHWDAPEEPSKPAPGFALGQSAKKEAVEAATEAEQADMAEEEAWRDAEKREAERLEAEQREAAAREAERLEAEQRETAEREAERLEAEQREAAEREAERLEAEQREAAAREAERLEAEQREAAEREAERLEAEQREAAEREAERLEAEQREAAEREAERLEAEQREAAEREAEKLEAEQREAAEREAERLEAEQREAAEREAEWLEAEQSEAAEREAERLEAERREAAEREAERLEAEQREAAEREVERLEAEQREAAERSAESRGVPSGVIPFPIGGESKPAPEEAKEAAPAPSIPAPSAAAADAAPPAKSAEDMLLEDPLRVYGEIVSMLGEDPEYASTQISDLNWLVAPAISVKQALVARAHAPGAETTPGKAKAPVGAILWARLSDKDDEALRRAGGRLESFRELAPDWQGGERVWIVAITGPVGVQTSMIRYLDEKMGQGRPPTKLVP